LLASLAATLDLVLPARRSALAAAHLERAQVAFVDRGCLGDRRLLLLLFSTGDRGRASAWLRCRRARSGLQWLVTQRLSGNRGLQRGLGRTAGLDRMAKRRAADERGSLRTPAQKAAVTQKSTKCQRGKLLQGMLFRTV
jgi:hypothetical protein